MSDPQPSNDKPFVVDVTDGTDASGAPCYDIAAEFQGVRRVTAIAADLAMIKLNERQQAMQWLDERSLTQAYVVDFGGRLFQTLFTGPILILFREALTAAGDDRVRIVLRLPPSLSSLPWELMYDDRGRNGFLARATRTSVMRHYADLGVARDLPAAAPLRVLIVAASPDRYTPLSTDQEIAAIQHSLTGEPPAARDLLGRAFRLALAGRTPREIWRSLRGQSLVEIEVLTHATRASLQHRLAQAAAQGRGFHILHFAGHGDTRSGQGQVLLENEDGKADFVPAEAFAEIIDQPSLGLVVLNACLSASPLALFNGLAYQILSRRIPAVLGMQVTVFDQNAVEFAREFYGMWAVGYSIEEALSYARRLTGFRRGSGIASNWSVPVLYANPLEHLRLALAAGPPLPALRRLQWLFAAVCFLVFTGIPTVAFYRSLLPPQPQRMERLFNIAVADFGEAEHPESEPVRDSEDGRWLGQFVFDELKAQLETVPDLEAKVDLQHDYVGLIRGDTPAARQLSAARLAGDLNADIVIFGSIDKGGVTHKFAPEFYVSPRLTGAEETTGPATFGALMRLKLPLRNRPENATALTREFVPRDQALTRFMFGLAFLKADIPDQALAELGAARDVKQWEDGKGKEIVYLWIGTAHLDRALSRQPVEGHPCAAVAAAAGRAGVSDLPDETSWTDFDCARAAYSIAQMLNPAFARAYVGLGKVWFDQVEQSFAVRRRGDCSAYLLAAQQYSRALEPQMQAAETAFLPLKAHFNLGVAYANGYANGCDPAWQAQAAAELRAAIAEYDRVPNPPPLVLDLGVRAHFQLARLYFSQAKTDQALAEADAAIRIATPSAGEEETWQAYRWNASLLKGLILAQQADRQAQDAAARQANWQSAAQAFSTVIAEYRDGRYDDVVVVSAAAQQLARARNSLGQPDQAVEPANLSIELAGDADEADRSNLGELPWTAYLELGRAYTGLAKQGAAQHNEAEKAYRAVITQAVAGQIPLSAPTIAEAYWGLGTLQAAAGQAAEARASFEQALNAGALPDELEKRIRAALRDLPAAP